MAKEMITFKCGHTEERSFFGPYKERARKMQWLAGQLCQACHEAEKAAAFEAKKAAEAAKAEAIEAKIELPDLIGTEKQVPWARSIRAKAIEELESLVAVNESSYGAEDPRIQALKTAVEAIKAQDEARFWIDNRTVQAKDLIRKFYIQ